MEQQPGLVYVPGTIYRGMRRVLDSPDIPVVIMGEWDEPLADGGRVYKTASGGSDGAPGCLPAAEVILLDVIDKPLGDDSTDFTRRLEWIAQQLQQQDYRGADRIASYIRFPRDQKMQRDRIAQAKAQHGAPQ